uniref:Uncharacterized protein n=1 Tax=Ananas comosus var. bracteatus TaxID=296719 RepID=A0A6V7Q3Q7_ANACO|nr:unnamed protein product [Ananas comosus var. bracteatus]
MVDHTNAFIPAPEMDAASWMFAGDVDGSSDRPPWDQIPGSLPAIGGDETGRDLRDVKARTRFLAGSPRSAGAADGDGRDLPNHVRNGGICGSPNRLELTAEGCGISGIDLRGRGISGIWWILWRAWRDATATARSLGFAYGTSDRPELTAGSAGFSGSAGRSEEEEVVDSVPTYGSHPEIYEAFEPQLILLEPLSRLLWKGSSSPLELVRDFHHYRELGGLWAPSSAQTKAAWNSWWVWPHQNEIKLSYDDFYLS